MSVNYSYVYRVSTDSRFHARPGTALTPVTGQDGMTAPFTVSAPFAPDGRAPDAGFTLREFVCVTDATGARVLLNGNADPQFAGYMPDPVGFVLQSGEYAYLLSDVPGLLSLPDFVAEEAVCFAAGTMIATDSGEVAVERLQPGDKVATLRGVARVRWVGYQTLIPAFHPAERISMVSFSEGSLAPGVPKADLTVTGDHAILVDGVLCHAAALVNGTTIRRLPQDAEGARVRVYHVETSPQEIIFANGAPAETFLDNISRRVFHNYGDYLDANGPGDEIVRLPYPRALGPRQLPVAVRRRLAVDPAA